MRFLSLFSGIEAASVAWAPLGWECAAFAEIEPLPCALLAQRFPSVPNLGDVTKITRDQIRSLGKIDVVVAGFPCQDVSVAGRRRGLRDEAGKLTRSGLFHVARRVIRWARPRWTVLENVPGLFTSRKGRDFATVVGKLAGCQFDPPHGRWRNSGVAAGRLGLVEWVVLDAQWFGLAQRRKRVFLVRDSGDWASRPPVLLEPECLRGNPPPSREARKDVADSLTRGSARRGDGGWSPGDGLVVAFRKSRRAQTAEDDETWVDDGRANTLNDFDVGDTRTTHAIVEGLPPVAWALQEIDAKGPDSDTKDGHLIPVMLGEADRPEVPVYVQRVSDPISAVEQRLYTAEGCTFRTINLTGVESARAGLRVRRLTPTECERLQGFPDGWTRVDVRGRSAADGPRYRALGNSMPVPVMAWIGRGIERAVRVPTQPT